MPTIKQLIRNTRQPIRNVTKSPALGGCPQRRGTCTRVYVRLVQIMGWDKTKERKQFFQYQ
uniref:Ribosomal protein S12 n=2 Tax=Camellia TaxID=4441 RepID=U5U7M4_CAMSI|nr:ribosomal protein S12 [Camellia sinensis]